MEVTIGVQNVAREIAVETDSDAAEVTAAVEAALRDGGVLKLTDTKGRAVLVPGSVIGWVQVGENEKSKVGFSV
ncbi:DUF3107 domain-containing protein [Oryzobacter telluris]|uniref:DUF3107 domain-containing protein n=1 Tax=Oryzobacter telluris TaxID=3149179 RepID=UPI00370D22EB